MPATRRSVCFLSRGLRGLFSVQLHCQLGGINSDGTGGWKNVIITKPRCFSAGNKVNTGLLLWGWVDILEGINLWEGSCQMEKAAALLWGVWDKDEGRGGGWGGGVLSMYLDHKENMTPHIIFQIINNSCFCIADSLHQYLSRCFLFSFFYRFS